MTFMKKILSVLSVTSLAAGVLIVTAQPASAVGAAPITVDNTTIANGQAQTVRFGSGAGVIPTQQSPGGTQQALCLFLDGAKEGDGYKGGSTVPATLSISAGTFNASMNRNFKAVNRTLEWVWFEINMATGELGLGCADLDFNLDLERANDFSWSSSTVDGVVVRHSVTWTVTPALSSPLAQTIYINENNTTPVTVSGSYLPEVLDVASRTNRWRNQNQTDCNSTGDQVDLAALGLTLNTADSAIGETAPLIVSGTPTASSVGTYQLCLKLAGENSLYSFFNLTVAERTAPTAQAPAPTLAKTGTDSRLVMASGLIGTIAIGLGTAFLAFRRRMNAE
jgi:LPXTG-motif cell wall-anchored protein